MQPTEHWIIVPLPPFVDHLGDITTKLKHYLEEENISFARACTYTLLFLVLPQIPFVFGIVQCGTVH